MVLVLLLTGCARRTISDFPLDMAGERLADMLRQTNNGLLQFKSMGRISILRPKQPKQSFRAAIAGQLPDRLRIDLIAPYGGSAGTISSDGRYLYLVMHASGEYHKKCIGNGSLRRVIHMDITVAELLEFMMGRVPMVQNVRAQLFPGDSGEPARLTLIDRKGDPKQRITLNASMQHPITAQWLDRNLEPIFDVTLSGSLKNRGFTLPEQIRLASEHGEVVTVLLERYEANADINNSLFTLRPLSKRDD
jgi:outer membrane lipoprotein-sorting protein